MVAANRIGCAILKQKKGLSGRMCFIYAQRLLADRMLRRLVKMVRPARLRPNIDCNEKMAIALWTKVYTAYKITQIK